MILENVKRAYFIGIGGIGMSALARYFNSRGVAVSGYDRTPSALTDQLIKEGMPVHFEDNPDLVMKDADLAIYTPAIPADHRELQFYRDHNYALKKRAEVLAAVTAQKPNVAISGTHGKTTVSTMTAHLLKGSGLDCSAFLGGIAVNYGTNFLAGAHDLVVAEADEFDRSFLRLTPDIAVVTSDDPDHLDIYGDAAAVRKAFEEFVTRIKPGGLLVARANLPTLSVPDSVRRLLYGLGAEPADCIAQNIRIQDGAYRFDYRAPNGGIDDLALFMGGRHNVENAVAALTVARELKRDGDRLRAALASFRGVRRRFEYVLKSDNIVFIDDYAHHPSELRALLSSARELYPNKEITVIFQPHLFSRTRDFADGFAGSLSLGDRVLLLPIYPAREKPMANVTSEIIFEKIVAPRKSLCSKEELLDIVRRDDFEVVIAAGAGDISELIAPIGKLLSDTAPAD